MKGGDILKNKAFKHILSIGYELETIDLIKLTEITTDIEGEPINMLLNTDSSQREITEILESKEEDDDSFTNLGDKEYVYKRLEKLNLDVGKENVSFNITNDMAESRFIKRLKNSCVNYSEAEEEEEEEKEEEEAEEKDETDNESNSDLNSKLESDLISKKTNYKNQLYKYEITDKNTGEPKIYDINFLHGPENVGCSIFSDVEWVVTYYKPKIHSNVILETITDTIKILLKHFKELIPNKGEFLFINPDTRAEKIIGDTELYHLPDSTLYYLKTNAGGLDTIFTTIQMTFSAHVSDIFFILKQLIEDNLQSYNCLTIQCNKRIEELDSIKSCAENLITSYNETELDYKIVTPNKLLMREIYNYIILILYKLYVFYNTYYPLLQEIKEDKYFKSFLPFNVRHNNYQLYVELKRCLKIVFNTKLVGKSEIEQDQLLADIIKSLFIQKTVLINDLLYNSNESLIRKNAFNLNNKLEITNTKNYGNPYYSLVSYFDFFEHPIGDNHDWFEYKNIDANSTKMKIKDDIILVEFRAFPTILKNYISSVLDVESRNEMNEMTRNTLGLLSFRTLEKFIKKYDQTRNLKGGKTKKRKTNRKRNTKKRRI
jgi:hypothetical protein